MKIWLVQLGEPLPMDGPVRLYRTGILAAMLAERGYNVTWWAATFDHTHKRQRQTHDYSVELSANYRIKLLYAKGYRKNVSLSRIFFHRQMAHKFARHIQYESPPDIILSCLPTPNLSKVAVDYGKQHNIPVIIDVRDLWPDIFFTVIPSWLHWLARLILLPAIHVNRHIFRRATGIIGISTNYLEWGLAYANRSQQKTDAIFPLGYKKIVLSEKDAIREKQNLLRLQVDPTKVVCCFFGVFGISYDLETIIAVAKLLKQEGETQVQFVLCGDGQKLERLKHAADGLDNVIFPGWVSRMTIAALMSISAIGLVPYIPNALQSLPNKPFEYFSGGLPVVSSLRGELESILAEHDCGITYTAGDVQDLLRALRQLYTNPQKRQQMKKNSTQLFESRFSADCIYPSMIKYLEQIANGKVKT